MTRRLFRLSAAALVLGIAVSVGSAAPAAHPASVDAASCIRIVGGRFDSPGNDNYMPYLNGEYVTVRNGCATAKLMTGWKVNDYGRKHTYSFPSGYRIAPGVSVKLHSGLGTNNTLNVYWKRSYGAVWNNSAPERAYLRNPAGTAVSSWSSY